MQNEAIKDVFINVCFNLKSSEIFRLTIWHEDYSIANQTSFTIFYNDPHIDFFSVKKVCVCVWRTDGLSKMFKIRSKIHYHETFVQPNFLEHGYIVSDLRDG